MGQTWEYLEKDRWIKWRRDNKLSLRQVGKLLKVTGELVRQWELNYCIPNIDSQKLMLDCLSGKIEIPKQEKQLATNQQLKSYLTERNFEDIRPSLLAKLAGISILKAKQWLKGDLVVNVKSKFNTIEMQQRLVNFLEGKYDDLIPKKNTWLLLKPEQLKNCRLSNKFTIEEALSLVGTSRPNYYNWEQNKYAPDLQTQEKLLSLIIDK